MTIFKLIFTVSLVQDQAFTSSTYICEQTQFRKLSDYLVALAGSAEHIGVVPTLLRLELQISTAINIQITMLKTEMAPKTQCEDLDTEPHRTGMNSSQELQISGSRTKGKLKHSCSLALFGRLSSQLRCSTNTKTLWQTIKCSRQRL